MSWSHGAHDLGLVLWGPDSQACVVTETRAYSPSSVICSNRSSHSIAQELTRAISSLITAIITNTLLFLESMGPFHVSCVWLTRDRNEQHRALSPF